MILDTSVWQEEVENCEQLVKPYWASSRVRVPMRPFYTYFCTWEASA